MHPLRKVFRDVQDQAFKLTVATRCPVASATAGVARMQQMVSDYHAYMAQPVAVFGLGDPRCRGPQ